MGGLRTYDVIMTPADDGSWVLKSEAIKVIAEKDEEIRRLKRALYKACSNWADATQGFYDEWAANLVDYDTIEASKRQAAARRFGTMADKCLKKAEEYK